MNVTIARSCPGVALVIALTGLAVLSGLITRVTPASAMSVSPVYLDMKTTGPRSRADITVTNRSSRPLPIEAVVSRITFGPDGEEARTRNEADFLVLPMQAMIPPGGTQVLKVQWLGEPLIERSRSYRISINQLPVAQPGEGKTVQVLVNFAVVVTIAPPEGTPALKLVSTGIGRNRDGRRVPTVTVHNPSSVHARLPHARLRLSSGSWNKTLSTGTLSGLIGIGAVMPGQTRTFRLPLTLPANVSSVKAELEYREPDAR
jgi:P pilus assembly chaperone PapD